MKKLYPQEKKITSSFRATTRPKGEKLTTHFYIVRARNNDPGLSQ
jgi:hypothetical protein